MAVLAVEGGWVSRERMAFLFWPDITSEQALVNLRQLLVRVKRLTIAEDLEREAKQLRWVPPCDVVDFRNALRDEAWERAAAIYGGVLLDGFELDDAPEFSAWLELERRELEDGYRQAIARQADRYERAAQHERALDSWAELLAHDPLNENALQQILRLAAAAERQDEAVGAFHRFAARLREEFGLEPQTATQSLFQMLDRTSVPPPRRIDTLPFSSAPYVGRDPETTELLHLLAEPQCRLLTLVGAGGIGKSALALQLARSAAQQFPDGAVLVPLVAVRDAAEIPDAIAAALSLGPYRDLDPESRGLDYLRNKQLLLLLDNLEHLPGSAPFISRLLESCPGVVVIATSRARIGLRAEWLFQVEGLNYPEGESDAPFESYDAVRLFALRARQIRPDFVLAQTDADAIVAICRAVAGAPLGLELAASWTRLLSCREIADALTVSLDALTGDLRDLPERHRSLRAVFESSWNLLAPGEQSALRRLSVFRGGFDRAAAVQIAGAGAGTLLALLDRSLLRRGPGGRFDLHELVREYAAEKLAEEPDEQWDAHARHGSFFAALVDEQSRWLRGGVHQQEAVTVLAAELDNIRSALQRSIERRDAAGLAQMIPLWHFFEIRGRYREGEAVFERMVSVLAEPDLARARAMLAQAVLAGRLGEIERSRCAAEECGALFAALGVEDALVPMHLGVLEIMERDFEAAAALHHEALRVAERTADPWSRATATANLGVIAMLQGDDPGAEHLLDRARRLMERAGEHWGLSIALGNLCDLAMRRGDLVAARRHCDAGLAVARGLDQRPSMASFLLQLGQLAEREARFADAETSLQAGLEMARDLGLAPLCDYALALLGHNALLQGRYSDAWARHAEALASAVRRNADDVAREAVVHLAEVLGAVGRHREALELLSFAWRQPPSESAQGPGDEQEASECAARLYRELGAGIGRDELRAAAARGAELDYPEIVRFSALPLLAAEQTTSH